MLDPGFEQFFGDIAGDFNGFVYGSSLRDQARNIFRGGEINALREFFDVQID